MVDSFVFDPHLCESAYLANVSPRKTFSGGDRSAQDIFADAGDFGWEHGSVVDPLFWATDGDVDHLVPYLLLARFLWVRSLGA